ncbi:MAG: hypothetical protein WB992_16665, partial [Bryobacteraceae bacterium]
MKAFGGFSSSLFAVALGAGSLLAFTGQSGDPSQWSSDEIYRILHDSPWTKTAKLNLSEQGTLDTSSAPNVGTGTAPSSAGQMPGRMGGMGRRGTAGGTYSSGSGNRGADTGSSRPQATEVTIQWQSALPVRLAAAKDAGQAAERESLKSGGEYVVAVIGLPLGDFGARGASADSEATIDQEQTERVENALKGSTSLLRSGHDPLSPMKVELDQGRDGRVLFHFPKTDPITVKD